jgi:peptide/nickel transport system permease protein
MGTYIIRRLLWMLLVVFLAAMITFVLIFMAPGDPARALVGEKALEETVNAVRVKYGLDQPIYVQFARYLSNLARGDLGDSYYFNRPVTEAFFERFPATALLAISILVTSLVVGLPLGVIAALRAHGPIDRTLVVVGSITIAMPTFFIGIILIYFVAFQAHLTPVGGYGTIKHMILPTLSVAIPWATWYAIVLRSNMLEVMSADYARTARAKGLAPGLISRRHLVRNAILPIVTMLGMDFAGLLSGLVLIEQVFSYPGVGQMIVQAARNSDVPMILGAVIYGAVLLSLGNLVADISHSFLDPRVRVT